MEKMKPQEFFDCDQFWRREGNNARLNPVKSIRAFCLQCVAGQRKEVELCPSVDTCPLWPFRFGTNPFHKIKVSEDHRKKNLNNLKKAWQVTRDSQINEPESFQPGEDEESIE